MTPWEVAIPSYQRADRCADATLRLLSDGRVPPERIRVFVANDDEAARYRERLDPATYAELVVGRPGLRAQRNLIRRWYPEGTRVVSLDDDLETFVTAHERTGPLVKVDDVAELFSASFSAAERAGLTLWGVYPVANPYFMRPQVTTDLRFIIGHAHGYVATTDSKVALEEGPTTGGKEDVEQTIRWYERDGGVLRWGNIAAKTRYRAAGGLAESRTPATELAEARRIVEQWPHLASLWHRKDGRPEIRLRDRRR